VEIYDIRKIIARLNLKAKNYQEAYEQYINCIEIAEKYFEIDHVELSDLEERCGEICILLKNSSASGHFRRASKFLSEKVGEGHMKVTELSLKAENYK